MAYTRRNTTDGVTVMNKDLYDNLQDGIENKPFYYDSVADMKADLNLKEGMKAVTLGYYNSNDGGGAVYIITTKEQTQSIKTDKITLQNNLVALHFTLNNSVKLKQLGATPTEDISSYLERAGYYQTIIFDDDYFISNRVIFRNPSITLCGNNHILTAKNWKYSEDNWCILVFIKDVKNSIVRDLNIHVMIQQGEESALTKEVTAVSVARGTKSSLIMNCHIEIDETPIRWTGFFVNSWNTTIKDSSCVNKSYGSTGGSFWCLIKDDEEQNSLPNIVVENCYFDSSAGDEVFGTDFQEPFSGQKIKGNIAVNNTTIIKSIKPKTLTNIEPSFGVTLRGKGNFEFNNCYFKVNSEEDRVSNPFCVLGSDIVYGEELHLRFFNCNIQNKVNCFITGSYKILNGTTWVWVQNLLPVEFDNCNFEGGCVSGNVVLHQNNVYDTLVQASGIPVSLKNCYIRTKYNPVHFERQPVFNHFKMENCIVHTDSLTLFLLESGDSYFCTILDSLFFTTQPEVGSLYRVKKGQHMYSKPDDNFSFGRIVIKNTLVNGSLVEEDS